MEARSLYDDDIIAWADQQAAALRALASQYPELSNAVDWENIIEEIECLGRSELKGVESLIRNALTHILKGFCDPASLSRLAWSVETDAFLDDARRDFRNSMRQKIDLDETWREAFRKAARELRAYGGSVPSGIPQDCPFTLDEITAVTLTYGRAVQKLFDLIDAPPHNH